MKNEPRPTTSTKFKSKNIKPTYSETEIAVTIVVTESTKSLLHLDAPHLENVDPNNEKVCLISAEEIKKLISKANDTSVPSTSKSSRDNKKKPKEELKNNMFINSDLAFFSNSTFSTSSDEASEDVCVIMNAEEEQSSKKKEVLLPKKIIKTPLASARTAAHKDKFSVKDKNILVSLLDTESSTSEDMICRICHGTESTEDLLTPCRCRGTIAVVHLKCLERWLRESSHSYCELCQHHYKIVRQPKYSIPWSILLFLRHPGGHLREILIDLLAFSLYTPSAVASTYMLMMLCESLMKNNLIVSGSFSSHFVAFSAVFGMAAIDFTYSSWLMVVMQRHYEAWREWYKSHSELKVVLSNMKLRLLKKKNVKKVNKSK